MSRNSFICTVRSLRAPFNYTFAPRGWEREGPPQNPEGLPPRLLFLTPTRSNRIIDGIKRRSVWVSFKQRLVGARVQSWGIVTSLGRWSSSKTSFRFARPRVSTPVRPWMCTRSQRMCACALGWFAGRWAAPQLYWATSYYDNAARYARTPEKQKRERRIFSRVLRSASRRSIFCLQGTKTLFIENDGWWSHRYISVEREKKIVCLVRCWKIQIRANTGVRCAR